MNVYQMKYKILCNSLKSTTIKLAIHYQIDIEKYDTIEKLLDLIEKDANMERSKHNRVSNEWLKKDILNCEKLEYYNAFAYLQENNLRMTERI